MVIFMNKQADLILADGEKCADMRYASGFDAPDSFLYFRVNGKKYVMVSVLEYDRAKTSVKPDVEVLSSEDFSSLGRSLSSQIREFAARYDITSFRVPADFPLLTADLLRKSGIEITPHPGKFFPEREFKKHSEAEAVTAALRVAENAVREACKAIGEASVDNENRLVWQGELFTSERLRRIIDLHIAGANGQPTGTIAAGGVQSAEPHNSGSGVLYAHTPIVMDVFPRMMESGYWGDLTRTVSKGAVPEIVERAYNAVLKARDEAKKLIRPGVNPAGVHNAANEILEKAGFPTGKTAAGRNYGFFHGLGHGVGLEIHEAPRLSPANTTPLKGGEIITVEPGLYDPAWGGIRLEDMVYVTEDGAECLTELETFLVIE